MRLHGCDWEPVDNHGGPINRPVLGVVEHVTEGQSDPWGWFANPASKASSTCFIAKDGRKVQYVDTDNASWAQAAGNYSYWSIETEGVSTEALTDAQIESFAQMYAEMQTLPFAGFGFVAAETPGQLGLGWHGMGGAAWGGHFGCPGDLRKAQRGAILARAQQLGLPPKIVATYGPKLDQPAVGLAITHDGGGYWIAAKDGGVFAEGDAPFKGALPGQVSLDDIVGFAARPQGDGYWMVGADGGVFAEGPGFFGSMGGKPLSAPVVDITATPTGEGYWLVAADGGVFSFGDAVFHGSMGGVQLNAPVVSLIAMPDGSGYWLVAADGGVFAFGGASYYGSTAELRLAAGVLGAAAAPDGGGYWLLAADGGVFSFGSAPFFGSMGGKHMNAPITGLAATPSGKGYALIGADGGVFTFGDAVFHGSAA